LKDLKLGGNLLYGPLDPCFSKLQNLEILDLHGNNLSSLPSDFGSLSRLRILNLSENSFEELPFELLARLPLTELVARKNQLHGTLFQDNVEALSTLQTLDVSSNQLVQICSMGKTIAMPALHQLCVSMNRLQSLPDVSGWTALLTLAADENNINAIPDGFTGLAQLRSVDFSSNDIRVVPAEIGRMENLANLRLSGNPLREKKFSTMSTEEMKSNLAQRLEPPPEETEEQAEPTPSNAEDTYYAAEEGITAPAATDPYADDDSRSDSDNFATPPTSAPGSPARSRSQTVTWPVKSGGVLDRSNTESSSLHPVICSKLATTHRIYEVQLHHNLFPALPDSLTFFAETLTALSLAHNQLVGESYLGASSTLDLPALKELNLAHNHITGLTPLVTHLRAPNLQKLDISFNRVSTLPQGPPGPQKLRDAFPQLTVLLASNNHLSDLDPEAIRGLRVVDAANNDIAHLNPRIGLLGGQEGGLERLEVSGNRFRVPRWSVLERGTEATLRWLRGRVPVAEMAGWKGEEGEEEELD
jgi:Leucine-rich repeat (LRR) protein